ncbi:isopentenyl phosphate kinase family protein [Candidatus Bathyarchaeota archaeon]|nr:isopentenyl phosphate kinase family protein [Candidatus Bathyarchaeota archaeon]
MQVLKLGGSVVTDKDRPFTANRENIRRLSMEIAEADAQPLVIVHGGGSYGHPLAKEYDIADGYSYPRQVIGFSRTHQAMVKLNGLIVDALLAAGVPAFSVTSSSFIKTKRRRIRSVDLGIVRGSIENGLVPVLYGDAVIDTEQGFAILSGDQLVVKLAAGLIAEQIVLGSDVDGVYTADPKLGKGARLIKELSIGELEQMTGIGDAVSTDVTGGMFAKIREAAEAVEAGVEVLLVNATEPGRVRAALRGENVIGTRLRR